VLTGAVFECEALGRWPVIENRAVIVETQATSNPLFLFCAAALVIAVDSRNDVLNTPSEFPSRHCRRPIVLESGESSIPNVNHLLCDDEGRLLL